MFLPNQKQEGRQSNVNKIGSEQSNTQNHQDNDKYEAEKQMGSNEQSNYFGPQHSHTLQKGKSPYPSNNLFKEVIIEDENEENIRNPSNQYSRLSGNSGNQSGNNNQMNMQKKAKRGYGIE